MRKILIFLRNKYLFPVNYIKGYFKQSKICKEYSLTIETTNVCDANCVFCPNRKMKRERNKINFKLFKKSVDQFVKCGGKKISFSPCIGEPLLDNELLKKRRYLTNYPTLQFGGITTNMQWFHKIDIDQFFKCDLKSVTISSMFLGREKYKRFFGVDRYPQFLKNVKTFLKQNNLRGNPIEVNFSLKKFDESIDEITNHRDFKQINELSSGQLLKDAHNIGVFVDDWNEHVTLPKELKKRPLYPRQFRPCRYLGNSLIVFSNGKIGLCPCRDFEANSELILGNIKKDRLDRLWAGIKHKKIITQWVYSNKIPQICQKCSFYK